MTGQTATSGPALHRPPKDPRAAYKPITLEEVQQKEDGFFKDLDTRLQKGWRQSCLP